MKSSFTKCLSVLGVGLFALFALGAQSGAKSQTTGPLPFEGRDTVSTTLARTDVSCILRTWKALGVLVCSHGYDVHACLWVENAYPCGIMEVIRQPYKTQLAEMKSMIERLAPLSLTTFGSSSHSPMAGDGTSTQFGDARVYTYVPDLGLANSDVPIAIPSYTRFEANYVTEMDSFGWRSPMVDQFTCPEMTSAQLKSCGLFPDPVTCMGTWASWFPRIGFVMHPSQALGATVQALRAGRAASRPMGRVVMSAYEYEPRTGHYIQMIEPVPKLAISIGTPFPALMDLGAGSTWGNYLFVHFGIFQYCAECLPVRLVEARPPV